MQQNSPRETFDAEQGGVWEWSVLRSQPNGQPPGAVEALRFDHQPADILSITTMHRKRDEDSQSAILGCQALGRSKGTRADGAVSSRELEFVASILLLVNTRHASEAF